MTLTIRAELEGDAEAIRRVVASAFPTEAESNLVDELRRSGDLRVSLVALDGSQVVGHVAFSAVAVAGSDLATQSARISVAPQNDGFDVAPSSDGIGPAPRGDGIGLAPVAVLESYRRRGIAAQLIERGLASCRELGFRYAVVLGEPAYYSRFGFTPAALHGLGDEYGGGDAFQVLALSSDGIPENAGLVRYVSAFAALS